MNDYFDIDFSKLNYLSVIHNITKFRKINNLKPKQL